MDGEKTRLWVMERRKKKPPKKTKCFGQNQARFLSMWFPHTNASCIPPVSPISPSSVSGARRTTQEWLQDLTLDCAVWELSQALFLTKCSPLDTHTRVFNPSKNAFEHYLCSGLEERVISSPLLLFFNYYVMCFNENHDLWLDHQSRLLEAPPWWRG